MQNIKKKKTASETGHAKNVANFETVLLALVAVGAEYTPTQPLILLAALQAALANAQAIMILGSTTTAARTLAVDARDAAYKDLGKFANAVGKATAVAFNDDAFNADMESITRLINGKRAGDAPVDDPATPDVDESQNANSVSHLSYDNLEANFGKQIKLIEAKGDYELNEVEYELPALKARHALLKSTNIAAKNAYIAEDNAREQRDKILYDPETGILKLVELIKAYVDYRFTKKSAIYKQINALKFKRVE